MNYFNTDDDMLWTRYDDSDRDYGTGKVEWLAHPIVRRDKRYIFVDPHSAAPGCSTSAAGWQPGDRTERLERMKLESAGRDSGPYRGSAGCAEYFTTAKKIEVEAQFEVDALEAERRRKEMEPEMERRRTEQAERAEQIRRSLVGKLEFHEVYPGVYRLGGFHVYAHAGRKEQCGLCNGSGRVGRKQCTRCRGRREVEAMENYMVNIPSTGSRMLTFANDLDEVRERHVDDLILGIRNPSQLAIYHVFHI